MVKNQTSMSKTQNKLMMTCINFHVSRKSLAKLTDILRLVVLWPPLSTHHNTKKTWNYLNQPWTIKLHLNKTQRFKTDLKKLNRLQLRSMEIICPLKIQFLFLIETLIIRMSQNNLFVCVKAYTLYSTKSLCWLTQECNIYLARTESTQGARCLFVKLISKSW